MPIIILIVGVVILLLVIGLYNNLIRKRNEVDFAFAAIDTQLKKRYDLIPNLVATVQEYARHEKELLTKVAELRAKAVSGNLSQNEQVDLNNQLSSIAT
jgi:LemA protein